MFTRIRFFDAAGVTNQWPADTLDQGTITQLPRTTTAFAFTGIIADGPHAGETFVYTYRGHMRPAANAGTVDGVDMTISHKPVYSIELGDPVGYRTFGEDFNDRLADDTVFVGNAYSNRFTTQGGADTLFGGAGRDALDGGAGNDRLNGGLGADVLQGGAGADVLIGGAGNDVYFSDGHDRIVEARGGGLDAVVAFGSLRLPDNVERLVLGIGAVEGWGNRLGNGIAGNNGANVLRGLDGNDTIEGGLGADTLLGGNGHDVLVGFRGRDVLSGGAGADVLAGGTQADWLSGGGGADRFVFEKPAVSGPTAATRDTIADFRHGDVIDLSEIDARADQRGNNAFSFIGGRDFSHEAGELRYVGGIVTADLDGDGRADLSIALTGAPALGTDDFVL